LKLQNVVPWDDTILRSGQLNHARLLSDVCSLIGIAEGRAGQVR
jgi:hypothetical protein